MKKLYSYIFLCFVLTIFTAEKTAAEGTRQLMLNPAFTTKLIPGGSGASAPDFALYNTAPASRINVHIKDPSREQIWYGFGRSGTVNYRLFSPANVNLLSGSVGSVGTGKIFNHTQAITGPNGVAGITTGYEPLKHIPAVAGDYSFGFGDPGAIIDFFDICVVDIVDNKIIPGRVWSVLWGLTSQSFATSSYANFFIYSEDSVVTSMNLNGMKGYGFSVFCNSTGPRTNLTLAQNRQSIPGERYAPQYKIFLNNPDSTIYPTYAGSDNQITAPLEIIGCPLEGYNVLISVAKKGAAEIYIERNGIPGYQQETADVRIDYLLQKGQTSVPWDGKDGLGNPIPAGEEVKVFVTVVNGLTNFPMVDVEGNPNGLKVELVRPQNSNLKIFWDDRQTGNNPDDVELNLEGCTTPLVGCHKWVGNNGGAGYGNEKIMNTWWYTFSISSSLTFKIIENCPVYAEKDTVITDINTAITFNPIANDYDPDGNIDTTSVKILTAPKYGSLTLDTSNGSMTYTPNADFHCWDTAIYQVSDLGLLAFGYPDSVVYSDIDTIYIKVAPPSPTVSFDSIAFCQNTAAPNLAATAPADFPLLAWYDKEWGGIPSGTTPKVDSSKAGLQIFYVSAHDGDPSCDSRRIKITVNVLPAPVPRGGADVGPGCPGTTFQLGLLSQTNIVYEWLNTNGIEQINNPRTRVKPVYYSDTLAFIPYVLKATNATTGCITYDTVIVKVQPAPKDTVVLAGEKALCLDTVTRTYSIPAPQDGVTYNWSLSGGGTIVSYNSSTSANIRWTTAGTHTITVKRFGGILLCEGLPVTAEVKVGVTPNFTPMTDTAVCPADSIKIGISTVPNASYAWTPGTFLSDPAAASPTFVADIYRNTDTTYVYRLTVTDTLSNCVREDTVNIRLKYAFSPKLTIALQDKVCQNDSIRTYKVSDGPADSSYNWQILQIPATITSGQGTNEIGAVWSDSGEGRVIVKMINTNGCLSAGADTTVTVVPTPAPKIAQSRNLVCLDNDDRKVRFVNDSVFISGTTHQWFVNGTPTGTGDSVLVHEFTDLQNIDLIVVETYDICTDTARLTTGIAFDELQLRNIRLSVTDDELLENEFTVEAGSIAGATFIMRYRAAGSTDWINGSGANRTSASWLLAGLPVQEQAFEVQLGHINRCGSEVWLPAHTSMLLKGQFEEAAELVDLNWTAYIGFANENYTVLQNLDNSGEKTRFTVGKDTMIKGNIADEGFTHCYRIKATDSFTNAVSYSNTVCHTFGHPLTAPNVITPNGDGANDYFVIDNMELYSGAKLYVFDRWGKQVYTSSNYQGQWSPDKLDAGVYFYHLNHSKAGDVKGYIQIVR